MPAGTQSLAITEKRAQARQGGCAGIFFHLVDWNRRLSKKKLFSKKLLPSVRAAKWVSKKLGGDDKMPKNKLLLIAEENRGGFPSTKESAGAAACSSFQESNAMRAPGLVARLMGLESMPVVDEKPRKALDSQSVGNKDESLEYSRLDQDLCQELGGSGRNDFRPQKLQKTGGFLVERQPVSATRFGASVLSKNLLSRSRKQQHKLIPPVKSPRALPRRSSARLMGVATKILEPGLQSRNRAKCAITYVEESDPTLPLRESKETLRDVFVGSCKSCGSLVEVGKLRLGEKEDLVADYPSSALDLAKTSSCYNGFEDCGKMKPPIIPQAHEGVVSLAIQAKMNVQSRSCESTESKDVTQNFQDWCKPRQNLVSNCAPRSNNLRQSQLPMVKDKALSGSKVCGRQQITKELNEMHKAKDFVTLNKNMTNSTRTRSQTLSSGSHRLEKERNGYEKTMARKRRPICNPQIENVVVVNSSFLNEKSGRSNSSFQKGTRCTDKHFINGNSVKNVRRQKATHDFAKSNKDNGVVSLTLNSSMGQESRSLLNEVLEEKSRGQDKLTRDVSNAKKLVLEAKTGCLSPQQGISLTGNALSSLLDQKIRELTSLNQDELATGDDSQGRSTASILEELISAITMGASISQRNVNSCSIESSPTNNLSDVSDYSILHNKTPRIDKRFHEEVKIDKSAAYSACEGDHPSPLSILEASFSNDSSFSETFNVSSGHELHYGSMESSCNQADLENDLLDSATSLNIMESTPHCKSYNARAISNAELLIDNIALDKSDETMESSIDLYLLDTLEAIVESFFTGSKGSLDFTEVEEGNQLRRLLFDCMIECLDAKCSFFCISGYSFWLKLPLASSKRWLIRKVHEEIRGWRDLAGVHLDDLIEKEMACSISKWIDCVIETFETGIEIESEILKLLINETVVDLC